MLTVTIVQYLTAHEGLATSQFLVTAQAGTEPTSGSATLKTYVNCSFRQHNY